VNAVKIFISHAHADQLLADALIHLLEVGLEIPDGGIRCTSADGHGLEGGESTASALRADLRDAAVVLGILTPSALSSTYVLMELGAAWAFEKAPVPILAGGLTPGGLPGPFADVHALRIDHPPDMADLLETVSARTQLPKRASAAKVQVALQALLDEGKPGFFGRNRGLATSMTRSAERARGLGAVSIVLLFVGVTAIFGSSSQYIPAIARACMGTAAVFGVLSAYYRAKLKFDEPTLREIWKAQGLNGLLAVLRMLIEGLFFGSAAALSIIGAGHVLSRAGNYLDALFARPVGEGGNDTIKADAIDVEPILHVEPGAGGQATSGGVGGLPTQLVRFISGQRVGKSELAIRLMPLHDISNVSLDAIPQDAGGPVIPLLIEGSNYRAGLSFELRSDISKLDPKYAYGFALHACAQELNPACLGVELPGLFIEKGVHSPALRPAQAPAESESLKGTHFIRVDDELVRLCAINARVQDRCGGIPYDSSRPPSGCADVLTVLAACATRERLRLKLTGHTDLRGGADYNMTLGQSMANSVAQFLVAKGMDKDATESSSRGAMDATGSDEAGWARDRRVDITIAR
jgi:peptidoglycan-associated lipoprotein